MNEEIEQRRIARERVLSYFYSEGGESIPLENCKDRGLYLIYSRNLALGVFVAKTRGFIGIRNKFDNEYTFSEYHFDTGAPFGTVQPKKYLEDCPIQEDNEELFKWLKEKEAQYLERSSFLLS